MSHHYTRSKILQLTRPTIVRSKLYLVKQIDNDWEQYHIVENEKPDTFDPDSIYGICFMCKSPCSFGSQCCKLCFKKL